jgi:hypothetical protein
VLGFWKKIPGSRASKKGTVHLSCPSRISQNFLQDFSTAPQTSVAKIKSFFYLSRV